MMPWGHAAVAIVGLVLVVLVRYQRLPRGQSILVVLGASQLPDLVDKPLAHTFDVIPSGRVFFHSLVIAGPFLLAVLVLTAHYNRASFGRVIAWGHLSHLAGDFYPAVLQSSPSIPPELLWPLVRVVPRLSPPAYEMPSLLLEAASHSPGILGFLIGACLYALIDLYRGQRSHARETV